MAVSYMCFTQLIQKGLVSLFNYTCFIQLGFMNYHGDIFVMNETNTKLMGEGRSKILGNGKNVIL